MGTIRDVQVRNWINAGKPLAKTDGDGLTFTLSASGTASWVLRYRLSGKQRELTLGRYPDVTIAAARKLATEKRVEVQQGVDVARKKQKAKLDTAREWTFKRLADDYLTYLTERRKALELWSAKIAALEKGEAFNVVPFKRAANE
jgi:hypothetical protein